MVNQFILFFVGLFLSVFADDFNYAPKILRPKEEKRFVICVPSYNNEFYYKRNLDSIFSQNYSNYRVIYVDDASKDKTYELVSQYIHERGYADKFELWRNEENKGAMYNHYQMICTLEDDEIYVSLDGDDWFANRNVLTRLNQAYADEDVWVTYGSWVSYPSGKKGDNREVRFSDLERGIHRMLPFLWTQIRTCYARLFKLIRVELFKDDEGNFLPCACDVAYMFNIIDMAGPHVYYIPDVLYVYNIETEINDHKKDFRKQLAMEKLIRDRPPLKKIEHWRE